MEERRRITILAAVNADQRVAATMVAVKAARDDRERKAQRAEELGVVGKSLQQLFEEQSAASEKVMREAQRGSQGTVVDQRSPPPDIASELTESPVHSPRAGPPGKRSSSAARDLSRDGTAAD